MSAARVALYSIVLFLLPIPASSLAAEVGTIAPDFSLPSLGNLQQTVDLASNRGKLLYLDFWSAWCEPCREKMPKLEALETAVEALEVIGINVDPIVSDAYHYLSQSPVDYPIALDTGGNVAQRFGVDTLPIGFLIDQQGVIRGVTTSGSEQEFQKLTSLIEQLSLSMSPVESVR
jgi:cytochrome c biogenesis protein CcmG/thiol:disulfide interchange protein DsbE